MIPVVETLLDAQRARSASWEDLFVEHAAAVHAYAQRLTGNRDDADDLTQETFIRAIPALERFDDPNVNVPAYLYATCRNTYFRTRARGSRFVSVAEVPERPVDDHFVDEHPERALLLKDEQEGVRIANARLVPRQRMALALRELEDKSYGEIGEIIGVSENAVAQLIFRARANLRREIRLLNVNGSRLADECRLLLPEMSALVDGELHEPDIARVSAHVDSCVDCREVIGMLAGASETVRVTPVVIDALLALKLGVGDGLIANGFAVPTASSTGAVPGRSSITRNVAVGSASLATACALAVVAVMVSGEPPGPQADVSPPPPIVASPGEPTSRPAAEPAPQPTQSAKAPVRQARLATSQVVRVSAKKPTVVRPIGTAPPQPPTPKPTRGGTPPTKQPAPNRNRKAPVEVAPPATAPSVPAAPVAAPPPPAPPPVAVVSTGVPATPNSVAPDATVDRPKDAGHDKHPRHGHNLPDPESVTTDAPDDPDPCETRRQFS